MKAPVIDVVLVTDDGDIRVPGDWSADIIDDTITLRVQHLSEQVLSLLAHHGQPLPLRVLFQLDTKGADADWLCCGEWFWLREDDGTYSFGVTPRVSPARVAFKA